MTTPRKVVGTAIRSAVLNDNRITALIQTKAYANVAPGRVATPYITWEWNFGGKIQMSPKDEFDTGYLITAISNSQVQAETLSEYIHEVFDDQSMIYRYGYACYAPVTEENTFSTSFFMTTDVQGELFWKIGAIYRFRGVREFKD